MIGFLDYYEDAPITAGSISQRGGDERRRGASKTGQVCLRILTRWARPREGNVLTRCWAKPNHWILEIGENALEGHIVKPHTAMFVRVDCADLVGIQLAGDTEPAADGSRVVRE